MEYVVGVTLSRLVRGDAERHVAGCGPLPPPAACDCVRQAALGLQHVFECGLVHRDVKPSNLLLSPPPAEGQFPAPGALVRLLDLGLVRLQPLSAAGAAVSAPALATLAPGSDGTLTPDGILLGSLDFVAPEQAERPREADIRADLYALGCTFYFLLTGQVPFPAASNLEKLRKHRYEEPPPLAWLRPDVPPRLADVVARLMEKRPADRFQTPGELAEALLPFCQAGCAPSTVSDLPTGAGARAPAGGGPAGGEPVGELLRIDAHDERVTGVAASPDGTWAVSASWDRTVKRWDVASGREVGRFVGHTAGVNSVAVSPDGTRALSGGADHSVRLWDAAGGGELLRLLGHEDAVTAVAFAPDGRGAVSASLDGTLRLWDLATGRELRRFAGHRKTVNAVAFAPDGRLLVSGGGTFHHRDCELRLWDVETGRELGRLAGHTDAVTCVAFAPDGRRVLSGGWDQTVRLWDVGTWQEVGRFEGHRQLVWSVAFAPDGRRALSGSRDRTLRLWDVSNGDDLRCFRTHSGWVTSVAVLPDGRRALSGSADRTLRLWQLPE
jgi:predicted NACHT family NTPase